jgi:ATP-binding cassette subfamily F protein 3
MLLNPSNLLLLDEPTNHLDLDSKEVLLDALADYDGTLVFVSHDRYFVDRLATQVVDVGGGEALLYPGGYEDFLDWQARRAAGEIAPRPDSPPRHTPAADAPGVPAPKPPAPVARPVARAKARSRPRAAPAQAAPAVDPLAPRLRKKGTPPERQVREREARRTRARIAELERQIETGEARVKELELQMSSPGFYDDRERADRAASEHRSATEEVAHLMREWESLQELVES